MGGAEHPGGQTGRRVASGPGVLFGGVVVSDTDSEGQKLELRIREKKSWVSSGSGVGGRKKKEGWGGGGRMCPIEVTGRRVASGPGV